MTFINNIDNKKAINIANDTLEGSLPLRVTINKNGNVTIIANIMLGFFLTIRVIKNANNIEHIPTTITPSVTQYFL